MYETLQDIKKENKFLNILSYTIIHYINVIMYVIYIMHVCSLFTTTLCANLTSPSMTSVSETTRFANNNNVFTKHHDQSIKGYNKMIRAFHTMLISTIVTIATIAPPVCYGSIILLSPILQPHTLIPSTNPIPSGLFTWFSFGK